MADEPVTTGLSIGDKLKALRSSKSMTIEELADAVKLPTVVVSQIEQGVTPASWAAVSVFFWLRATCSPSRAPSGCVATQSSGASASQYRRVLVASPTRRAEFLCREIALRASSISC